MAVRLRLATPGYGYLTCDGSNDYGELPAAVGVLTGSWVLEVAFRLSSYGHRAIISKLNPNNTGSGSSRGWLLGTTDTGRIKYYYCPSDSVIYETDGATYLSIGTDYIIRLICDGFSIVIMLSANGGSTWTTEATITDAGARTAMADSNVYMTVLGRGRWNGGWVDYWYGRIGMLRIIRGSSDPTATPANEYRMSVSGSNPTITDRYGAANGQGYNGISGTVVAADAYATSGTAVYGPFRLPTVSSHRASSIGWTATTPAGTTAAVETAVVAASATPVAGDWSACANGGAISGLISGGDLYIRSTLATTDTSKTPSLSALQYAVEGADNHSKVRAGLTYAGRLRHPQGDLTAAYAASSGNLRNAAGNLAVPSFSLPFTPGAGVAPLFFNPHDPENISASLELSVDVNKVAYQNTKSGDENLQASLALSVGVFDTNNNPV